MIRAGWVVMAGIVWGAVNAQATERLNRGLVALRTPEGVYIGWRLLASDPADVAFHVYRQIGDNGTPDRLSDQPLPDRTNFVDSAPPASADVRYFVRAITNDGEGEPSPAVAIAGTRLDSSFTRIKLDGQHDAQRIAPADLDGDGQLDFIIKQPNDSIDPWVKGGYWKRSPDTYKIEAYRSDGRFLWRYDMGWAIEQGTWYSPLVVYDLDGDGRAEVYAKAGEGDPRDTNGMVTTGEEWVVQIDGLTGKVLRKAPWPDRTGYRDYNWTSRNLMAVAYLDGKKPSLIVQRGTYNQIKLIAYDATLNELWQWNSRDEKERYSGTGAHGTFAADVDGDGRDEIVLGASVVDDTGRGLWTNPMHHPAQAHPDVCHVGDIDPDRPGLEIFYGFETAQPRDGVCLMDARTGRILWSYDGPTTHVHSVGMAADILAEYPGQECYGGEQNESQYFLYTAKGERIGRTIVDSLNPRGVFWDADPQKELIMSRLIQDYRLPLVDNVNGMSVNPGSDTGGAGGETAAATQELNTRRYIAIEGTIANIADCVGDWREEILTTLPGELRIYTTTIPADTRHVCLLQDRQYRLGVTNATMGYFYPAQLSRSIEKQ